MTTPDGRKIDFFLIGPPKCGSTTCHDVLSLHPDIFMPECKDKKFLVDTVPGHVTEAELPAYYTGFRGERLVGCSETTLICVESAIRRLHRYNPDVRTIAVLRNPIDRAYSAYWFARQFLAEDCDTFEEALHRESERESGDYLARSNLLYRRDGRYADHLDLVYDLFPRDNVHVGLFEDLRSDPARFFAELTQWLGVDPEKLDTTALHAHSNSAGVPRSRLVQQIFGSPPAWLRNAYHAVLPARFKAFLWSRVVQPVITFNRAPFRYPPMAAATRAELSEYFAPHNERLATLLGRDLTAWR